MDVPSEINADAPDWSTLDFEVTCPRCGYNLAMLAQPRCPECGLQFDWLTVVAASREARRDSPLFEYRWRNRPVRSFLYTGLLCLMPARLWKRAELTHTPRAAVIWTWALLMLASLSGLEWAREQGALEVLERLIPGITSITVYSPFGPPVFPSAISGIDKSAEFLGRLLLLPVIVIFISVYRVTFVRYRIIWLHLLRVGVYVWAAYALWKFVANVLFTTVVVANLRIQNTSGQALQAIVFGSPMPSQDFIDQVQGLLNCIPPLAAAGSLWLGFAAYLRIHRAWAGALCSIAMITLAYFVLCVTMAVQIERSIDGYWMRLLDQWIPATNSFAQLGIWFLVYGMNS